MSKPKTAKEIGFECFKVRVVMPGAVLHLVSRTEPRVTLDEAGNVAGVAWDLIDGTEHGDTVGFIRLGEVSAITWRAARLDVVDRQGNPLRSNDAHRR